MCFAPNSQIGNSRTPCSCGPPLALGREQQDTATARVEARLLLKPRWRAAVGPWEPLQAVLPATRSMLRPFAVRLVSVFTHLFLSATSVVACYEVMPVKETVKTLLCSACQLLLAPDGRPTRTTSPFRSRASPARSIPGRMSLAESGWSASPAAPRSAFVRTWKP